MGGEEYLVEKHGTEGRSEFSLDFGGETGLFFSDDAPPRTTGAPFGRKIG